MQQTVDNLSTSLEQAVRTYPVNMLLEQYCYKSAAGLLQLVRFYVCILERYGTLRISKYSPQNGALNLYVGHLQNARLPSSEVLHTPLYLHGLGVHLSWITTPENKYIHIFSFVHVSTTGTKFKGKMYV
jgi:hypothetical protein